jgi:hypothetical protein
MLKPGDHVIYVKTKQSVHPGPRAKAVEPSPNGDDYSYVVDKFWTVVEIREDNKLLLMTRRGKTHLVDADSPHIRRPRWWERLLFRDRFPSLPLPQQPSSPQATPVA